MAVVSCVEISADELVAELGDADVDDAELVVDLLEGVVVDADGWLVGVDLPVEEVAVVGEVEDVLVFDELGLLLATNAATMPATTTAATPTSTQPSGRLRAFVSVSVRLGGVLSDAVRATGVPVPVSMSVR